MFLILKGSGIRKNSPEENSNETDLFFAQGPAIKNTVYRGGGRCWYWLEVVERMWRRNGGDRVEIALSRCWCRIRDANLKLQVYKEPKSLKQTT